LVKFEDMNNFENRETEFKISTNAIYNYSFLRAIPSDCYANVKLVILEIRVLLERINRKSMPFPLLVNSFGFVWRIK
jgi:hypothetical protein